MSPFLLVVLVYFRIMAMYPRLIAPILFKRDPESIHHTISNWMERVGANSFGRSLLKLFYGPSVSKDLSQTIWGIHFPHPIGMAAGFDKDARTYKALHSLGFCFVEIGTVTPKPQEGNPKPRLFRLKEDSALINRMGFNNEGLEATVNRLRSERKGIVGGNIGKNKVTPNKQAIDDYLKGFEALFEHVDYFTVNVSSPNTPGLRELQDKEPLLQLLSSLQKVNQQKAKPLPIMLKIAPDMSNEQLLDVAAVVKETALAGVVATNTTIDRTGLKTSAKEIEEIGAGGLSGRPLKTRSNEVISILRKALGSEAIIIGVGGVETGRDAIEKIVAGANLVQVYTGFVYQGPAMVKRCLSEMEHGLKTGHWTWPHRRK